MVSAWSLKRYQIQRIVLNDMKSTKWSVWIESFVIWNSGPNPDAVPIAGFKVAVFPLKILRASAARIVAIVHE